MKGEEQAVHILFAILCIFTYPTNINEQVNVDHWTAFFLINAFPHNKL